MRRRGRLRLGIASLGLLRIAFLPMSGVGGVEGSRPDAADEHRSCRAQVNTLQCGVTGPCEHGGRNVNTSSLQPAPPGRLSPPTLSGSALAVNVHSHLPSHQSLEEQWGTPRPIWAEGRRTPARSIWRCVRPSRCADCRSSASSTISPHRGIKVGVTSLSYWQQGARRPQSPRVAARRGEPLRTYSNAGGNSLIRLLDVGEGAARVGESMPGRPLVPLTDGGLRLGVEQLLHELESPARRRAAHGGPPRAGTDRGRGGS